MNSTYTPVAKGLHWLMAALILSLLALGITFIKQAEEFGLLKRVTVAFLGFSETYLGAFGEGKGENMIAGVPFVASDTDPGVRDFVGRVRAMAGNNAGAAAAAGSATCTARTPICTPVPFGVIVPPMTIGTPSRMAR